MNDGAVYLNIEEAARIIAELRRHQWKQKMETGQHRILIGEIIHDAATPSPDDDEITEVDMEADNGTA